MRQVLRRTILAGFPAVPIAARAAPITTTADAEVDRLWRQWLRLRVEIDDITTGARRRRARRYTPAGERPSSPSRSYRRR